MEQLNTKKEQRRKYYLENKQKALLQTYEWRKRNPEKYKAINKKSRLNNIEKRKEYEKLRYWANPKKYREKVRLWRMNNPEKARKYHEDYFPEWKLKNIERVRQLTKNRKAYLKGVIGKVTFLEWKWLKEKYFNLCLACLKRESEVKLTQDHVVPISEGGKNTVDNIQPLCQSCNSIKHKKTIDYRQKWWEGKYIQ